MEEACFCSTEVRPTKNATEETSTGVFSNAEKDIFDTNGVAKVDF